MYTKKVGIKLCIVAIVGAICGLVLTMGVVSATDIFVGPGETYTTIRSAVTAANPFETIIVRDGTYTENVNVSKSLTIRSENGSASTIVQAANSSRHLFKISADYVNISGFTVTGATGDGKAGIYLNGVDHCNISHNNASNNYHGIKLDSSNNNTISNNTASYNTHHGLRIEGSSYNTVEDNTVLSNNDHGILMESSNNNNLTNSIASSSATYNGILMRNCNYNTLENNIANANNQHGIAVDNSNFNNLINNTANLNGVSGIAVGSSTRNTLVNNSVWNNEIGYAIPPHHPLNKSYFDNSVDASNLVNGKPFYCYFNQSDQLIDGLEVGHLSLWFCTNFTVRNVTVTNADGILMRGTTNSTVTDCISVNNTFGIMIDSSSGNNITNNNLSDNFVGIDMGKSEWNAISNNTVNANNASGTNFNGIRSLMGGTGIIMDESDHNQLLNNTASSNNGFGIVLRTYSQNNTILGNNASSNGDTGIKLDYSSYNALTNNTVSGNSYGFYLESADYNILKDNIVSYNSQYGIEFEASDYNLISGNLVHDSWVGLSFINGNDNNYIVNNYFHENVGAGIDLRFDCNNNTIMGNYAYNNNDGIDLMTVTNSTVRDNIVYNNTRIGIYLWLFGTSDDIISGNKVYGNGDGIVLRNSSGNINCSGNDIYSNSYGIEVEESNNSVTVFGNNVTNNYCGIYLWMNSSNNRIYNNYFDNPINAYDDGTNIWNITRTFGTNIVGGSFLGGNYWSDYIGEDLGDDGLGDTQIPYNSSGGIKNGGDWLPLIKPAVFDTGNGTYPSISGVHNGTIEPSCNISVSRLYTYHCPGTGGHTEYVKIWNSTDWNVTATWDGYVGDWHNLTFNQPFILRENETYNYTIRTGSYPQIIHEHEFNATGGVITCEEFKDVNGKTYINWIPAIKLFGEEVQSGPGSNCSITWDDDVQITANGAESIYPTLGINGSTIHLAWVDQRDGGGNREIYYNRSTDNGTTWQASDTRISNDPLYSIKADFAVNGDLVHLFWRDNRDGNFEEYLIQSTDGGVSWGPETRLTNDSGYSGCPFPVVRGDVINLFWRDNRLGTFKIYHKRSIDAGANWSQDTLLTPDGIQAEFPFPAVFGDTIHVVWRDYRDGNAEIYYKRSTDGGVNWTADQRLTNDPGESEHPKIVVQGNNLHVVWRDNRTGTYEVFYKRSIDGGQTWSGDTRLTSNSGQSLWPLLAVSDDLLHLLWCDDRDGSQALYYTYSSDRGASWEVETKLSECIAPLDLMGAHPMMVKDPFIHVVFNDNRTGENEIYYKRGTISCK